MDGGGHIPTLPGHPPTLFPGDTSAVEVDLSAIPCITGEHGGACGAPTPPSRVYAPPSRAYALSHVRQLLRAQQHRGAGRLAGLQRRRLAAHARQLLAQVGASTSG